MNDSLIVDFEELNRALDYLAKLESCPLENITWVKDGKRLDVNPELIKEWKFTGLNNRDFAKAYLHYE